MSVPHKGQRMSLRVHLQGSGTEDGNGLVIHVCRFPKIRGTILGVPIIRTIAFLGLKWVPTILGNYHIGLQANRHKR